MEKGDLKDSLTLKLSRSEALVFFEFLSRFADDDKFSIADEAELRILWDMLADLETKLAEPLDPDYKKLLERARLHVRDGS